MDIKKRLFINSNEVNAVLLSDQGEEYPVFLESLHNTIFLPELIKSGYALASLPYNFVKDGVALDSLPAETFTPDDATLESMFNAIGTPLTQEEIRSYIKPETAQGIKIPPTNYIIHTREDFIKYMEHGMAVKDFNDFIPINYFVAPSARFTPKEYFAPENQKYLDFLNDRRTFSMKQFRKLIDWLSKINYSGGADPFEVIDAYFAWGVDGLNATVMSKHREERTKTKGFGHTSDVYIIEYGFVDGMRNIYAPHAGNSMGWELGDTSTAYLENLTAGLGMDELRVAPFYLKTVETVTALDGLNIHILYNTNQINIEGKLLPTIRIYSPVNVMESLDLQLAMPGFENDLIDYCKLVSLSKYINERRSDSVTVSSYDLYYLMGMNFKTTLSYIMNVSGLGGNKSQKLTDVLRGKVPGIANEKALPDFDDKSIKAYLDGTLEDDGTDESTVIKEFFDSVFDGAWFDDNLLMAQKRAAMRSITYNQQILRAIHYVFDMSYDTIYEILRSTTEATPTAVFSNGRTHYDLDLRQSDDFSKAFNDDKTAYTHENIMTCNQFCYVLRVAREVAEPIGRCRHIAAEFLKVPLRKGKAMQNVLELEQLLLDEMHKRVTDPKIINMYQKNIRQVTLTVFFEVARFGYFSLPVHWGEGKVPVPIALKNACANSIVHCVDTLESFCNTTVFLNGKRKYDDNGETNTKGTHFESFCVNAYVTPEYVIPRNAKTVIKEYTLFTLWFDWKRYAPETFAKLVELGVLEEDFVAWSNYDVTQFYVDRSINKINELYSFGRTPTDVELVTARADSYNDIDTIGYYYDRANEALASWPNDKEFTHVPFITEYMYPNLSNSVFHVEDPEDYEPMEVPRQGEPVVRLGVVRDMHMADFMDIVEPFNKNANAVTGQYIRKFTGFSSEIILNSPNAVFNLPEAGSHMLAVEDETILDVTNKSYFDFRDIPNRDAAEYGFVNIYGRIWLFRAMNGSIWEAMI